MAAAFGLGVDELEKLVISLIQSGDINGRVDSQNKVSVFHRVCIRENSSCASLPDLESQGNRPSRSFVRPRGEHGRGDSGGESQAASADETVSFALDLRRWRRADSPGPPCLGSKQILS